MTDEERHRLCDALRNTHPSRIMCREAANEIERLAALVQSDAEPALPQALRDAAENLLIAIGMGWDIEGCVENLRAALAQSDTEPVAWEKERAIGMREAVHIMHAANLSSAELKLVDKHCDWQAFKHAFNAVMKARASRVLDSVDAIEAERAYATAPAPLALAQSDVEDCGRCWKCLRGQEVTHLVVCPECGNKRCPHASDHKLACTNSNEPGQSGSVYGPPITQPDAEPVAWQTRAVGSKNWYIWQREGAPYDNIDPEFFDVRPLYTAPPRSDVYAGLIEAAEWHEELAKEKLEQAKRASEDKKRRFLDISFFHDECASALRARAADRSRK